MKSIVMSIMSSRRCTANVMVMCTRRPARTATARRRISSTGGGRGGTWWTCRAISTVPSWVTSRAGSTPRASGSRRPCLVTPWRSQVPVPPRRVVSDSSSLADSSSLLADSSSLLADSSSLVADSSSLLADSSKEIGRRLPLACPLAFNSSRA